MRRLVLLFAWAVLSPLSSRAATISAVTFDSRPSAVFVPVREAAESLGWQLSYDPLVELITVRGRTLDPFAPRLSDGTWLISLDDIVSLGAAREGDKIVFGDKSFKYEVGAKRVLVDLTTQDLRAWQGGRLVYDWHVSSGREGKETPDGKFKALGKEPMHISSIYGSPMPFSVHVVGNIYIHGSSLFSDSPQSHGCIRLRLMEARNVAEEFYNWVEVGTPITIEGSFDFGKKGKRQDR